MICILALINPAATSLGDSAPATSSVTLGWDASAGTNVAGYMIYYGTASGSYTQMAPAGLATQTTISGLTVGTTYFFTATAADSTGLESEYSNEISFTVPAPQPELRLARTGTQSVVRWPTNFPGYTLQWSSSPTGAWANLTSSPPSSGTNFAYTNTASAARRFYRLKK